MTSPMMGDSPSSIWGERLSAVTSDTLLSNPTLIVVALMVTLIPIALFIDGIGRNPAATASPSAKAKDEATNAAREVKSKKNK